LINNVVYCNDRTKRVIIMCWQNDESSNAKESGAHRKNLYLKICERCCGIVKYIEI